MVDSEYIEKVSTAKVTSNIKDISEELNWRLRVFDSLSYPTLILKPDKTLISANKKFLESFQIELDNVIGRKCFELFYSQDTPCGSDSCPVFQVIHDKSGHTFTLRSQKHWEDRVFSPILDENGEIAYIIESIRDVTRIKSLESELSGIKEFIDRVIHSSASAIIAADIQGNIQIMNRVARELLGESRKGKLKIEHVEQLYPPGKAKEIMRMLRDERTGGKGRLLIPMTSIINVNGEEVPVEMSAAIIYDDEGNETATMAIYNDLRKKIEVERRLEETQKQLAQSDKMASLGQLAAGVAHEINNPLTGVLFYANLILEKIDDHDPIKTDLEFIIDDANRCKKIVKSLLVYSRKTDSCKSIAHINTLVETSLNLTRDQKIFGNIHIVKELSDEMMLVNVDTNKLNQVIINLVINAADAMDGKGTLTIRTYRDKRMRKVFLEIQDTGCGIPKENLNKIFDPFFTTKQVGKSTGLGLSITYGIVEEHGGKIRVKETGPEGTIFILEFPQYVPADDEIF
ncbi:MAG: ATP-binding protein [Desulfobacterales bacterium]|jgi:PAS domain S-box-containing protein|nr:ATP-binding protein [Desulfobacterales bacterium]